MVTSALTCLCACGECSSFFFEKARLEEEAALVADLEASMAASDLQALSRHVATCMRLGVASKFPDVMARAKAKAAELGAQQQVSTAGGRAGWRGHERAAASQLACVPPRLALFPHSFRRARALARSLALSFVHSLLRARVQKRFLLHLLLSFSCLCVSFRRYTPFSLGVSLFLSLSLSFCPSLALKLVQSLVLSFLGAHGAREQHQVERPRRPRSGPRQSPRARPRGKQLCSKLS